MSDQQYGPERKYSPSICTGARRQRVAGRPGQTRNIHPLRGAGDRLAEHLARRKVLFDERGKIIPTFQSAARGPWVVERCRIDGVGFARTTARTTRTLQEAIVGQLNHGDSKMSNRYAIIFFAVWIGLIFTGPSLHSDFSSPYNWLGWLSLLVYPFVAAFFTWLITGEKPY